MTTGMAVVFGFALGVFYTALVFAWALGRTERK